MNPCRLKIITACISPEETESDKEIIHYVSKNQPLIPKGKYNNLINKDEIIEEEKNINLDNKKIDGKEEIKIIKVKNNLKKKKIKQNEEKIYLIDGLFFSTNNETYKQLFQVPNKSINIIQTKSIKEINKDSPKLRSRSGKNNKKNDDKRRKYAYKMEYKHDNKINTFYNSRNKKLSVELSPNKVDANKIFNTEDNLIDFNIYKNSNDVDFNTSELHDYKKMIKALLDEKPKKAEIIDNIKKDNKIKTEVLLQENTNINYQLNLEINREDELKGEIIVLKNKYDILLNQLKKEEIKISEYQDIIKHKIDHEKIINNKKNEIINYFNNLDECLVKGDILLVTTPNTNIIEKYNDIDNNINNNDYKEYENEIKDNNNNNDNMNLVTYSDLINEIEQYLNYDIITLLLKGYFINMNLKNVDDIIDKIWIYQKPIQTFETLTEEILILIDNYINNNNFTFINEYNRNIIMNYFYSFCNSYNYMTKSIFKSLLKDKLGNFIEFNENYLLGKLYKYCNGKLSEFMKIIKDLETNGTGKIDIRQFIRSLKDNKLIINYNNNENSYLINEENLLEQNDIIDLLHLLIIEMKKNKEYFENNKENNINDNNSNNKGKINIFDLYYNSIINIINDNSKSNMPLYKGIIKKYLIDKNMNSMIDFLKPLLLKKDIIIKKDKNRYIKAQYFIYFLINNNVIGKNETFLIPYSKETLIDINKLVLEIDQAKPLLHNLEENT